MNHVKIRSSAASLQDSLPTTRPQRLATVAAAPQLGDPQSLPARFSVAMRRVTVVFQAIVSWRRGALFGFEALVRTHEPTLQRPTDLLAAAERLGRQHELGRLIRKTIAKRVAQEGGDWRVFVNMEPTDLEDDELYDAKAPLAAIAHRTVFELTERVSTHGDCRLGEHVQRLRRAGYRIAVDDLGGGQAGPARFTSLEPEFLKLDMSLVRGVDRDMHKQHVIRSLLVLSRGLGLTVVAQGVETHAEREVLAALGCDLMQGYLMGRPDLDFVYG